MRRNGSPFTSGVPAESGCQRNAPPAHSRHRYCVTRSLSLGFSLSAFLPCLDPRFGGLGTLPETVRLVAGFNNMAAVSQTIQQRGGQLGIATVFILPLYGIGWYAVPAERSTSMRRSHRA